MGLAQLATVWYDYNVNGFRDCPEEGSSNPVPPVTVGSAKLPVWPIREAKGLRK